MSDSTTDDKPIVTGAALDDLVAKYIELRKRKAELKATYEAAAKKFDDGMERAEALFASVMRTHGLTSLPTKAGTPYFTRRTSATIADKPAYVTWVLQDPENRVVEYLDLKANKTAIQSYIAETGGELPPGIMWREEEGVNVRTS